MNKRKSVFIKRKLTYTLIIIIVVVIYLGSSWFVDFDTVKGLKSIPLALKWMGSNLLPDKKAIERFPKIIERLVETTFLSIAVTVIAGICAFFFSLLGSKTTKINSIVSTFVRMVAAFFRNVPDVVWAMLLMFSFGQNILTGFFALFFTTFGLLTRAFIESIDEVSSDCVEALDATGATFMQKVFQGIIPSAITELITWVLFMIETNIRSSTLIGILTATGIGYLFDLYYKSLDFPSASLIVLCIVVLVIGIELLTNKIRKVIL